MDILVVDNEDHVGIYVVGFAIAHDNAFARYDISDFMTNLSVLAGHVIGITSQITDLIYGK